MRATLYFILVVLNNSFLFAQSPKNCALIDSVLNIPEIKVLLELDVPKDKNPIRIIYLKKKHLPNCLTLYRANNQIITITKLNNIPYNLNTGLSRDIIISQIKCKKKEIIVDVYLSNYRWVDSIKNNWHFVITFKINNHQYFIKDLKYSLWD